VRVTTAFSRLLRLPGVWVQKVRFEPDRVIVEVALKRRRLICPECGYSTAARKDTRPEDSGGPGYSSYILDASSRRFSASNVGSLVERRQTRPFLDNPRTASLLEHRAATAPGAHSL